MKTLRDLVKGYDYDPLCGGRLRLDPLKGARGRKLTLNLLALGDVGSTALLALTLLGGDVLDAIGICDLNKAQLLRLEAEMNQIAYPWDYDRLPRIRPVEQKDVFSCDVFVFCATKGVPPVGKENGDVRMAQLAANRELIGGYARQARKAGFPGLFAVVSDPVDLLCRAAWEISNTDETGARDRAGLKRGQIRGYGLGVMNARAAYYAKKDPELSRFLSEGRVFGPHGADLVVADSVAHYNDARSRRLTELVVSANLRVRELGFKPYIAPAVSSAAISILLTLRGEDHYSAIPLGEVWFGCKNRLTENGSVPELLALPDALYARIERAYRNLEGQL